MNANIETSTRQATVGKNTTSKEEIIVTNFDAARFRAPFTLRCAALLLDYTILIIAPVVSLIIARASGLTGAKLFENSGYNFSWLAALLLLIANFVILPVLTGRTIGKAVMGLHVVGKNGRNLTYQAALLRHLIGYPLTILTAGIGFLIAIFNSDGRALHDFLASTIVVAGSRKQLKIRD